MDDGRFRSMKDQFKKEFDVKADEVLVLEGCESDDLNVLGGKHNFLSHFCTFFNFNICYSAVEASASKEINRMMNDGDRINSQIDALVKSLDNLQ